MIRSRLSRSVATGLALAALAAPAASAQQDLRSPDTRDASRVTEVQRTPPRQYFASPDARDYAEGRGTFNAPEVMVVKVPATATPDHPSASALDWSDVAIGAGAALGVMLLAIGGSLAVRQSVTSRIA